MKKLSVVVAATFALLSFSAFAGGNCIYGHDAKIAKASEEPLYDEKLVDPNLLALLRKQKEQNTLIKPIATFN